MKLEDGTAASSSSFIKEEETTTSSHSDIDGGEHAIASIAPKQHVNFFEEEERKAHVESGVSIAFIVNRY